MYFKLYNNNHENIQLPFTGRIANGPDKKYVGLLNYKGSLSLFLISNMSRCERMVDRFMLLHYRRAVVLKHFYYHVFFSLALASAPTPPRAFYQVINRYSWMKGKNDLKKIVSCWSREFRLRMTHIPYSTFEVFYVLFFLQARVLSPLPRNFRPQVWKSLQQKI